MEKVAEIKIDALSFTLIRRTTRRTVALSVKADNRVVVLAPYFASTNAVVDFVKKNLPWIQKRRQSNAIKTAELQRSYTPGDTVEYLGRPYQLVEGTGPRIHLDGNRLIIPKVSATTVHRKLTQWYKAQATDIFLDRLSLYEPKVGHQHRSLRLSSAKTRWGSCTTNGTISLKWNLVMAPIWILDYVIVHELCHLVHMNHSASFWKLVKSICPEYREATRWLKTNGHSLQLPLPNESNVV